MQVNKRIGNRDLCFSLPSQRCRNAVPRLHGSRNVQRHWKLHQSNVTEMPRNRFSMLFLLWRDCLAFFSQLPRSGFQIGYGSRIHHARFVTGPTWLFACPTDRPAQKWMRLTSPFTCKSPKVSRVALFRLSRRCRRASGPCYVSHIRAQPYCAVHKHSHIFSTSNQLISRGVCV